MFSIFSIAHITKITTNKTKTITDYLVGKRVHKSISSCQLGSSLKSSFNSYWHENASVCNPGDVVQLSAPYIMLRDF